jgi:hypothetical protein
MTQWKQIEGWPYQSQRACAHSQQQNASEFRGRRRGKRRSALEVLLSEPTFNRYLIEYQYDGAMWCLELQAASRADAEARIKALPWARLLGEISFSASVRENVFTKFVTNLFRTRR